MNFYTSLLLFSVFALGADSQSPALENKNFIPISTGLPTMHIVTENAELVVDKDKYLNASIVIQHSGYQSPKTITENYIGKIKGRGNSTWSMPKKPYRIKLEKAADILGLPAHKDWALLANYADKTLLRNQLAFHAANELDLGWTPRARSIEVFFNSQYIGVYQLVETITVSKNRLNLTQNSKTDKDVKPELNGYLLEIDQRMDEDFCFRTTLKDLPFCLKAPEEADAVQRDFISNYINEIEANIFSENFELKYPKMIDVNSFIDFYLVNEVAKNVDAKSFSSIYLHKNSDGKLKMGPVWDFDLGFGNANYMGADSPENFWVKLGPWYAQLFKDPKFEAQVIRRWAETKADVWDRIVTYIDTSAADLSKGQENNFKRWTILDQYVWPNPVVTGDYMLEIEHLKKWVKSRMDWLDQQWTLQEPEIK